MLSYGTFKFKIVFGARFADTLLEPFWIYLFIFSVFLKNFFLYSDVESKCENFQNILLMDLVHVQVQMYKNITLICTSDHIGLKNRLIGWTDFNLLILFHPLKSSQLVLCAYNMMHNIWTMGLGTMGRRSEDNGRIRVD